MAISGRARTRVIEALRTLNPKLGTSSAMSATDGYTAVTTGMPLIEHDHYRFHADRNEIAYTVFSYATVIGYVLRNGQVIVPDVKYSVTTSHHQSLCRVYLNGTGTTVQDQNRNIRPTYQG